MLAGFFKRLLGSSNERALRRLSATVTAINALEPQIASLREEQFPEKTAELRDRLTQGVPLDSILPEAFALVREASRRALEMRHFDVQLLGGLVLHGGKIAEMRTGEGKTLVATLTAYANALPDKGVHIVTVNDYLSRRDCEWMGKIYHYLGLSTGVLYTGMTHEERQAAYRADITYGTNNEFGFDYLRGNMAFSNSDQAQRGLHYAIVDEVDSVLIDEARTPLIISGSSDESVTLYLGINKLIPKLKKQETEDGSGDYSADEKNRQAFLSEEGHEHFDKLLRQEGIIASSGSLYDLENLHVNHYVNACLRAHLFFKKDVDYIIKDNEIVIVDEFTGRAMPGRRWSDGLHQAIEAKENVAVRQENQTLATITLQNYFRLYQKIAGMTGTADTEAYEFQQIYGLEVVVIPTHLNMIRQDHSDVIFLKKREKLKQIVENIKECQEGQRPVLVGTTSIEVSEQISELLQSDKIPHRVLNAKFHQKEAEIIAQAGRSGRVTIATNMAGRGTDIVLGGNYEAELKSLESPTEEKIAEIKKNWEARHAQVVASGGLHVIASERHESRRIDNQLRGRSGRQGDPGSSRFYLSLEDDLMRIFASEKMSKIMARLGMKDDEAVESNLVSRAIENAQHKVEAHNFEIRKQLLEFDDVMNEQRKVFYRHRDEILNGIGIEDYVSNMRHDAFEGLMDRYIPREGTSDTWQIDTLTDALKKEFGLDVSIQKWLIEEPNIAEAAIRERVHHAAHTLFLAKQQEVPEEVRSQLTSRVILEVMDTHWREHLVAIQHLRQGIFLRGYANKNPKQEYKREAFDLFLDMLERVKFDVIVFLAKIQMDVQHPPQKLDVPKKKDGLQYIHSSISAIADNTPEQENTAAKAVFTPYVRDTRKVGRNEPCPCGSGKKYKLCHGKLT